MGEPLTSPETMLYVLDAPPKALESIERMMESLSGQPRIHWTRRCHMFMSKDSDRRSQTHASSLQNASRVIILSLPGDTMYHVSCGGFDMQCDKSILPVIRSMNGRFNSTKSVILRGFSVTYLQHVFRFGTVTANNAQKAVFMECIPRDPSEGASLAGATAWVLEQLAVKQIGIKEDLSMDEGGSSSHQPQAPQHFRSRMQAFLALLSHSNVI